TKESGCKLLWLGNFCLVLWDKLSHYTVDAKQNSNSRSNIQSSVQRTGLMALHLCPAASLWPASPLSARDHGGGVDSRLGLSCGRRGWHTGPTCETTYRQ